LLCRAIDTYVNEDIAAYLDKEKSIQLTSTITEVVYNNIKESILNRKLKPNQRIKIREIASFLGVSQTPVREAIQRLSADGFLVVDRRSDVKVIEIGITECWEIGEIITILDMACTKKVIKNINEKDLDDLANMLHVLEVYYLERKTAEYIAQNQEIHKRIWAIGENSVICETLAKFMERFLIVESNYRSYFKDEIFLKKSIQNHQDLMKALTARDEEATLRLVSDHWKV